MAKIIGNTTATPNPQPDWLQVDDKKADYIKNKPMDYDAQMNAVSFGKNTHAGGKGYKITGIVLENGDVVESQNTSASESKVVGYELSSTDGISVEDNYSVRLGAASYFCGTYDTSKREYIPGIVESIENNRVYVTYAPQIVSFNGNSGPFDVFMIVGKPELGDVDVGFNAFTEGNGNFASEANAHAEGTGNYALGKASHAEGNGNVTGYEAHAEGRGNQALGDQSHAEGVSNTASGAASHTEGTKNIASGKRSHAGGYNTVASGDDAFAHGQNNIARGENSVAFGSGTYAGGMGYKVTGIVLDNGIIITQETENPKKIKGTVVGYKLRTVEGLETEMNYSVRLGLAKYYCGTIASIDTTTQQILVNNAPQIKYLNTKQDDPDNDFIGNVLTITGRPELGDVNIAFNAVSFGKDNASIERNTFTAGMGNNAIGAMSTALGNGNVTGHEAFATGRNNKALGDQSSAFGGHNEVYGAFSQAHGDSNVVYSICASAEGGSNTINAKHGHVEGYRNIVDEAATGAHVEGSNNTTVVGRYSHVEGSYNAVLAGSESSHVEGDHNTIGSENGTNVLAAHAEGSRTVASASYAHAEGYYTKSIGQYAHSEGDHAIAEGKASHAGGSYTTASGLNSFTHGSYVNATEDNSVAFGQHNIPEGRLLSVGDGTEKVPSNAFEVFADGRVGAKTPAKELTDLVQLKQAIVLSRRAVESEEIDPTVMQFKENKNNPFELSVVAASKPKTPLTELHIPAIYNNKVVTSVGESAFKNIKDEGYPYNGLTTLTVAYGVEKIEGYAFEGCKALTYIDLPTTITEIGPMAFKQAGIKTLVLPPHIKLISGQAFRGTSIENIVRIPSTCTSIGYASKEAHCGKVFGSKVPAVIFEGVPEQIHENTFLDSACDIYVPWSEGAVSKPEDSAWGSTGTVYYNHQYATKQYVDSEIAKAQLGEGGVDLSNYYNKDETYSKSEVDALIPDVSDFNIKQTTGYSENAVMSQKSVSDIFDWISEYIGGTIGIKYEQNADGSYQVAGNGFNRNPNVVIFSQFKGEDVSAIKERAFDDCDILTRVTIPSSVTSIGNSAFSGCDNLTSITIPDSITSIGEYVFYSCDSLPNVTIPASITSIGEYALSSCTSLEDISVDMNNEEYADIDGNLYTKDKSTLICYAAGKQADSFTIPNTVTSISAGAFMDCSALTNVILPDGLVSIGDDAFCYCDNLVGVKNVDSPTITNIPDSVTEIGTQAFYGCSKLSGAIYLDDVSVGPFAFAGCENLTTITIRDTVKTIYTKAFDGCTNATVNCEAKEKPEGWNDDWCGEVKRVIWGVQFN